VEVARLEPKMSNNFADVAPVPTWMHMIHANVMRKRHQR